jgi:hypothetical protein
MCVNGKMIPVEIILRMEEGGLKENGGGGIFNYDMFDIFLRTFVNAMMYPHPAQQ